MDERGGEQKWGPVFPSDLCVCRASFLFTLPSTRKWTKKALSLLPFDVAEKAKTKLKGKKRRGLLTGPITPQPLYATTAKIPAPQEKPHQRCSFHSDIHFRTCQKRGHRGRAYGPRGYHTVDGSGSDWEGLCLLVWPP